MTPASGWPVLIAVLLTPPLLLLGGAGLDARHDARTLGGLGQVGGEGLSGRLRGLAVGELEVPSALVCDHAIPGHRAEDDDHQGQHDEPGEPRSAAPVSGEPPPAVRALLGTPN